MYLGKVADIRAVSPLDFASEFRDGIVTVFYMLGILPFGIWCGTEIDALRWFRQR